VVQVGPGGIGHPGPRKPAPPLAWSNGPGGPGGSETPIYIPSLLSIPSPTDPIYNFYFLLDHLDHLDQSSSGAGLRGPGWWKEPGPAWTGACLWNRCHAPPSPLAAAITWTGYPEGRQQGGNSRPVATDVNAGHVVILRRDRAPAATGNWNGDTLPGGARSCRPSLFWTGNLRGRQRDGNSRRLATDVNTGHPAIWQHYVNKCCKYWA
jgi:hypothetical protein